MVDRHHYSQFYSRLDHFTGLCVGARVTVGTICRFRDEEFDLFSLLDVHGRNLRSISREDDYENQSN